MDSNTELPSPVPQPVAAATVTSQFLTPTNGALLLLVLYIAYIRLFPKKTTVSISTRDVPIVFKTYTRKELTEHNGQNGAKILMGIRGNVYDVTAGGSFYGPGGMARSISPERSRLTLFRPVW